MSTLLMDGESTPLLANLSNEPTNVYDRFPKAQKRVIVATISFAGLIARFASGSFVPCVPMVARDLNTTGTLINYTVGVYMVTMALGTLVWAPYSGFYGRQPMYLISLPLLLLGSLGVSISQNLTQLVIGRIIQAFGASSFTSVGAATISDIYKLEERGTAMGIYSGSSLLGPALAPLAGGLAATYYSWRTMQLILFAVSFGIFILVVLFLPETSHPGTRGVDKITHDADAETSMRSWKWVWLNPFSALALLRGPNILFVAIAGAGALVTDIVFLIPMAYTIGPRYGILSPALIGACFLPSGAGNALGAPLAGRISDRIVAKLRKKRGGTWVPEDRLLATFWGGLILAPVSVLVCGLTIEFVPGTIGLVLCLVCLFMNGVGVVLVMSPSSTYYVDILNTQSAQVIAVTSGFRYSISAMASAGVLPLIITIGIGPTHALSAALAWLTYALVLLTIRYGNLLRAWKDVGYTTTSERGH